MEILDFKDYSSPIAKVRYSCSKKSIELSEKHPEQLYSNLEMFVLLLYSDKSVFKWTATKVIGNLSRVDTENRISKVIPKLLALFHSDSLITSSNSIIALAQIATSKPNKTDDIIKELLAVEKARYLNKGIISPECTNVAIGHLLDSLRLFDKAVLLREDVAAFIQRQASNTRTSVAQKASLLLKLS
jgi:hypothetical protein